MPFPLELDGARYAAPPDLAVAVFDAARAGQFPERRLRLCAERGDLVRDEVVGLVAALMQSGDPSAVSCGARLARAHGDPVYARLIVLALEGLDIGTLLHAENGDGSVEDELLEAAADLLGEEADLRLVLLERLRYAGLGGAEARVLARRGTEQQIRAHMPAVLLEGLPAGTATAFAHGFQRGDKIAGALLDTVSPLSAMDRAALWAAVAKAGVHRDRPELEATLVG